MNNLMETTSDAVVETVGEAVGTIADVAGETTSAAGEALLKGAVVAAATSSRWRSKGAVVFGLLVAAVAAGLFVRRSRAKGESDKSDGASSDSNSDNDSESSSESKIKEASRG